MFLMQPFQISFINKKRKLWPYNICFFHKKMWGAIHTISWSNFIWKESFILIFLSTFSKLESTKTDCLQRQILFYKLALVYFFKKNWLFNVLHQDCEHQSKNRPIILNLFWYPVDLLPSFCISSENNIQFGVVSRLSNKFFHISLKNDLKVMIRSGRQKKHWLPKLS